MASLIRYFRLFDATSLLWVVLESATKDMAYVDCGGLPLSAVECPLMASDCLT
jgi:hypothetical protein